jgi:hypothetical protein
MMVNSRVIPVPKIARDDARFDEEVDKLVGNGGGGVRVWVGGSGLCREDKRLRQARAVMLERGASRCVAACAAAVLVGSSRGGTRG